MIKVLFVCLGNICRSPMAEGVFQNMVNQEGLGDQIMVDSAGTASYHEGESAHGGTLRTLKKHNINYDGRSRPITRRDFDTFDYILAMDSSNLSHLLSRKPDDSQAIIEKFLDYAENVSETDVPDPYYNNKFDHVYDLILAGSTGLLEAIRTDHNL